MEFRILGPLEIVHEGRAVRVGAAKEQAVLAVLLLHAGEVVSRERLIDELWGESPPPTAAKAVTVHVSQLRKALGVNGADPIATRFGGYAIDVPSHALDAAQFEELVAEARARVDVGELEAAAGMLREALALWRGPALAGIALESVARNEIDRLEELRLTALLDRIDCELALGRHESVIGELEVLVAQYPLRERLRAQYMLALYRCGRQADALRTYREARTLLVDELGLEPSMPLQRLENAILNHDPALEAPVGVVRAQPSRRTDLGADATIVFVDAKSTLELAGTMDAGNFQSFLDEYGRIVRSTFERFGGRDVEMFFDTVTAAFPTAKEAALAAAAAQRAVAAFQPRLELKVALNTTDAPVDWSGPQSLRCARLCEAAEGGQIVVSDAVASKLRGEGLGWLRLRDLGDRSIAGEEEPLRVHELSARPAASSTRSVRAIGGRAGRIAVVATVVGVAAAFAALLVTRAAAPASVLLTPYSLGRIDPATNRLIAVAHLGPNPRHVFASPDDVWVLQSDQRILLGVNARTHAIDYSLGLASFPTAVTTLGRDLWVLTERLTLLRIEPDTSTIVQQIPLDGNRPLTQAELEQPPRLAVGDGSLWVSSQKTVWRVDPKTGRVIARIPVRQRVVAIAFGEGAVWVVGFTDTAYYVLSEINPRTDTVVANTGLRSQPVAIAAGAGGVWVAEHFDNTVWRIDPTTARPSAIINSGDGPWSIAVGDGAVWVAHSHDNTVSRIDPQTNRQVATIETGAGPIEIAAGKRAIWVVTSFRKLG